MSDAAETMPNPGPSRPGPGRLGKTVVLVFLGLWLAFQLLVPLRHLLYPGSPSWNEERHRFAWQMKLRDKKGQAVFFVRNPADDEVWPVLPDEFLLRHQARKIVNRPDMILQFAHYLARVWAEEEGVPGVEVRVRACVSLNGRKPQLLIDPERDLVKVERNLRHADWVLPLHQPFERPPGKTRRRDLSC